MVNVSDVFTLQFLLQSSGDQEINQIEVHTTLCPNKNAHIFFNNSVKC